MVLYGSKFHYHYSFSPRQAYRDQVNVFYLIECGSTRQSKSYFKEIFFIRAISSRSQLLKMILSTPESIPMFLLELSELFTSSEKDSNSETLSSYVGLKIIISKSSTRSTVDLWKDIEKQRWLIDIKYHLNAVYNNHSLDSSLDLEVPRLV